MTHTRFKWMVAATLFVALPVFAAEEAEAPAKKKGEKAEASAEEGPKKLEPIVHGFFIEAGVGGGYMAVNHKAEPDAVFPGISGNEGYGVGATVDFALGFDLTPMLAIQLIGGTNMISGSRTDRVRDLALSYGGAALRLSVALDERLNLKVAAGGALSQADNGVEAVESGPAGVFDVGLEYFVHVRHFSVGLDAQVLAPLSPMRVFVGLGPKLKYTF